MRDVGLAEELAQDALVAALQQWPGQGVPDNPGAWLMAAAKHHAIDLMRKARIERKHEAIGREIEAEQAMPDFDGALDDDVGDDSLRLVFTACHPVLSTEARVELNRAVGLAMAFGPATGLEVVDALTSEPSLKAYHPLPTVRGDLLVKLRRNDEARAAFERAATLTRNARERALLL